MRALKLLVIVGAIAVGGCQPSPKVQVAPPSVIITATSGSAATSSPPPPSATESPLSSATPFTSPVTAGTVPDVSPSSAAAVQLSTVAVKGRAPMTGYSRAQFGPAWPTVQGCDARNEVLRRDLTSVTPLGSCTVRTGTLVSPYTARPISFVRGPNSAIVQIDHVVALGDAWQTGAQFWTAAKREIFANDPAELLAVDGPSNEQKGDSDAASWLPANKLFRCAYVAIQVGVKSTYGLWVTQAEHDAIARVLGSCGAPTATTATTLAPVALAPTLTARPAPTTAPPVAPTPTPSTLHTYVTPGAFCSTAGATGYSKTGKPEVCKTTATDTRLRWRAA